ncbi:MAG: hypothetical protein KGI54_11580 [Pseudomonadota bacterium]|nr:hypothetical protein [Pseudomonadota bacterium]
MAFDTIESIFRGSGPATESLNAGVTAGQKQFLDEQKALAEAQTLRNLQQTYRHNEELNPLNLRGKELSNQGLEASLGGHWADSQHKQIQTENARQTQSSDIAGKIAENKSRVTTEHLKTLTSMGQMAGMLGAQLDGVAPGSLPDITIKNQFMQENNIHPESTVGKYIQKADASTLNKFSNQISSTLPAFVQAMAVGKQNTESQQKIHAASNATQLQIARENNDMRRDLAEAKLEADKHKAESKLASAKLEAKNVEASILAIPIAERTPEQQAQLEEASALLNMRSGAAMGMNIEALSPNLKSNATALGSRGPKLGTAENPIKLK